MRLFTALCFDEKTKNALFSLSEKSKTFAEGNFTLRENLHLTLVFIGETERKSEIESALSEIEFPKFSVDFSKTGTFEKGIFWVGTSENKELENLQKTVFAKLKNLGFEPEEREFVPHITLARKFRPAENFPFDEIEKNLPGKPALINRISLMKSERINGELKYTEIFSKELF